MKRRGMTLIELMVAMTIFVTVMTLAIGGFIAISRSRILVGNMKDSQQKIRIANEMIIRYAKQAEYVKLADQGGSLLELYFDSGTVNASAKKFLVSEIETGKYDLVYSECKTFNGTQCNEWTEASSLLGSQNSNIYLNSIDDVFRLNGVLPAVLDVTLSIVNEVPGYDSLSNTMTIQNAIILEGLK
jgi:prepilin-type N-terminal cleavage/methylation domain-containing protein